MIVLAINNLSKPSDSGDLSLNYLPLKHDPSNLTAVSLTKINGPYLHLRNKAQKSSNRYKAFDNLYLFEMPIKSCKKL